MSKECETLDNEIRKLWQLGDKVMVFSTSNNKWYLGQITAIIHDFEGEWLEILYKNKTRKKQVPREDNNCIKPSYHWSKYTNKHV